MANIEPETIALLKRRLEEAERNIQLCRQLLNTDGEEGADILAPISMPDDLEIDDIGNGKVVYGQFDGEHMKGEDGQLYPVPANYASKSKLVEGDRLKLTIEEDGGFVYKQIGPIDRKRVKGVFDINEQGQYIVKTDEKEYRILLASVTFYHIDRGDTVTILLPTKGEAVWGAVENVLKSGSSEVSGDEGETEETQESNEEEFKEE